MPEQIERQLATSLIGPRNVTRAVLPVMRQQRPGHLSRSPRPLACSTKMMTAREEKKAKADDVTMRMLASTLHSDFQVSVETKGALESFKAIRADVLLLGGSKSLRNFKVALDALEKVLPRAKTR